MAGVVLVNARHERDRITLFGIHLTPHGFDLHMAATLENIDRADHHLTRYLIIEHIPCDPFALRILLREALANAVIHGSGQIPLNMVTLALRVEGHQVAMKVSDSGPGFDWHQPRLNDGTLEEGSRGLALMRIYADRVTFNEAGNEVTLEKALSAMGSESLARTPT